MIVPGGLGNSVAVAQWESGNSLSAFPFCDDSLPDGFPRGILVDACVVVASGPDPSRADVQVGSLHVGANMASVIVTVGGSPALYCNVMRASHVPFSPVAMTSVMAGVSGMVAFGSVDFGQPRTYRGPFPLSESAVVRPVVGRLRGFLDPNTGRTASGVVGFELPDGMSVEASGSDGVSVLSFSADRSLRDSVPAPCSSYEPPPDMPVPVTNVNGVVPDADGRVAVVFMHDEKELEALA